MSGARYSEGDRVSVRDGLGTRSSLGTVAEDWPGSGPVSVRYDGKTKARSVEAKRVQPLAGRSWSANSSSKPARKMPSRVVRAPQTEQPPFKPIYRPPPPARSPSYLDFVRSHACAYCRSTTSVEAHHWHLVRGVGSKPDDFRTVPLCDECHMHFHDHGKLQNMDPRTTREFFLLRQVDLLIEWAARGAS